MTLKSFFFLIFIGIFCFNLTSQTKPFLLNDTLFISRDIDTVDYYHAVYIDSSINNEFLKWMTDFSFEEDELENLKESYKQKGKLNAISINISKLGLAHEYLPLYQFQDNYYLYKPSDWGGLGQRIICDSSLIYVYMDGPYFEFWKSITKMNDTYILKTYQSFDELTGIATVKITLINKEKGMYLWEYINETNKVYKYKLYVSKEKAHLFPMVVNYCKTQKESEFDFDDLAVEKLLKK